MSNYVEYKDGLEYRFTETLSGYRLHAMQWYPYALKTGNSDDLIVVEVFRVTNRSVEQAIHDLEIGVGYVYDEVCIRGQDTGIYLFETQGSEPSVQGGDWVKFFGPQ